MIFDKKDLRVIIFIFKVAITGFILMGLASFLRLYNNEGEYIWQLILFSFIVGSFILSITPTYLKKGQEKILPKSGFLIIVSGIIVLISYGFGFTNPGTILTLDVIKNISSAIFLIGIFLFCYGLSDLVIELAKNIFSKK